ncbi:hypothetical protein Bca52824_026804 [Brassica carinata]|uniref:Uncharacterized protein n=1 Tax=Brassica carinata TaxID=52824 RepID=A0A8X7VAC9_BRACI|nr:hypothetical protein Bca52824_026804 [Brassica carinata]
MGRKSEADIEVEKQELAARHTAQFGKSLGSQPGSEEERRQQALAMLRKKAQAKSDGKRVVADKGMADDAHKQAKRDGKRTAAGDSVTDGANKQAPPKRAKAPRHSSVRALVVENQQQRIYLGDDGVGQGTEKNRKRQAEASAWLLKKVADVLARGAVAGCKAEDFDLDALNALPAQPLHDPSAPRTKNKPSA